MFYPAVLKAIVLSDHVQIL